jgi:hypothetical protein
MLNHALEQTCSLIETTYNDDGDLIYSNSEEIACRFRWITDLDVLNNRESIRSDAMLWVKAGENIVEGSVIKFNDEYFRVRQLIEARRLRGEQIYFKKCLLDKQASGIEDGSSS